MITQNDAKKIAGELYKLMRKDIPKFMSAVVEAEVDEYIGHKEAAAMLGMSQSGLYQRKDIPYSKPGKQRVYSKNVISRIVRGG